MSCGPPSATEPNHRRGSWSLPARLRALRQIFKTPRLCTGRNSSTWGSIVRMPAARGSNPSKRNSGLSQTSVWRHERCSRSISNASVVSPSRSSPSVIKSTTAPCVSTRRDQHKLNSRSDEAIRVPPDQSFTWRYKRRAPRRVALPDLARDIGEPGAEQNTSSCVSVARERMQKMQEHPGVLAIEPEISGAPRSAAPSRAARDI